MTEEIELFFDRNPEPKCKNCGRDKGSHQAKTTNCPASRHAFTYFLTDSVYEPRKVKKMSYISVPAEKVKEAAQAVIDMILEVRKERDHKKIQERLGGRLVFIGKS